MSWVALQPFPTELSVREETCSLPAARTGSIISSISSTSGRGVRVPMEGTTCVEGIDIAWLAPRFESENEKLMLNAGAAIVLVDIRGPLAEDAENTGAEGPGPMDMPPTVGVGGTEKDGSSTSMGELARKEVNGPCW